MTATNNNATYVDGDDFSINNQRHQSYHKELDNKRAAFQKRGIMRSQFSSFKSTMTYITAAFAMLFIIISSVPALTALTNTTPDGVSRGTSVTTANAIFCSNQMGFGMDRKGNWESFLTTPPFSNESDLTWTLQEAIGGFPTYVNYHGEGKGDGTWFMKEKKENEWSKQLLQQGNAEQKRTLSNCLIGGIPIVAANAILGVSGLITDMAQFFAVTAFNPDFICASADPKSPDNAAGCINLLNILGGGGSSDKDQGVMGVLSQGIYYPLIILVVMAAAMWVFYIGIVKRELRKAMGGFLWVMGAAIVGAMMLAKPALIVSAPMKVSNVVSSCVLGAFSMNNCFTGNDGAGNDMMADSSSLICNSNVPGASDLSRAMKGSINNMTCNIWKAFILNPYSVGSFGASYDDFESKSGKFGTLVDNKKMPESVTADTFCISLTSSKSYDSQRGGTATFDGTKNVCNLVAYQLFLQNNLELQGQSITQVNGGSDARWYNVVYAAQSTQTMWNTWTDPVLKVGVSVLSLIMAALGTVIIFVTSLMALVYYISAAILMAFAPLFLLFGIHPGRGKSIMFGWLEKVISNVLKYIASAIFLVITVVIYSALLNNISNIAVTLLVVIIISLALFMYRREIVDMMGRVNMGGEQMSSKFTDTMKSKSKEGMKRAGQFTNAAVGSAVGSGLAGGSIVSGMKDGAMRDIKRGQGIFANAARQVDRNSVANRSNMLRQEAVEQQRSQQLEEVAQKTERDLFDATDRQEMLQEDIAKSSEAEKASNANLEHLDKAQAAAMAEFRKDAAASMPATVEKAIMDAFAKNQLAAKQTAGSQLQALQADLNSGKIDQGTFDQQSSVVKTNFQTEMAGAVQKRDISMSNKDDLIKQAESKIGAFADSQNALQKVDAIRAEASRLAARGEENEAKNLTSQANAIEASAMKNMKSIQPEMLDQFKKDFENELKTSLNNYKIDSTGDLGSMRQTAAEDKIRTKQLQDDIRDTEGNIAKLKLLDAENQKRATEARVAWQTTKQASDSFNPGDMVSESSIAKRKEEAAPKAAAKVAEDRAKEAQDRNELRQIEKNRRR